jgi:hypothetical protein
MLIYLLNRESGAAPQLRLSKKSESPVIVTANITIVLNEETN